MNPAHLNRKTVSGFRQSIPARARLLVAALTVGIAGGCKTPHLHELISSDDIAVRLDSNSKAHMPGRQIKFYVDLINQTDGDVDVQDVKIELKANPRGVPETVSLRQTWRYRWATESPPPPLRPGKRMTIPVVPERGVEFPLEILSAGDYEIVAVVNERFTSLPYPLVIVRPDLEAARSGSTNPGTHRTFEGETRKLPLLSHGSETDRKEGERS